jgi:hypothetical protein
MLHERLQSRSQTGRELRVGRHSSTVARLGRPGQLPRSRVSTASTGSAVSTPRRRQRPAQCSTSPRRSRATRATRTAPIGIPDSSASQRRLENLRSRYGSAGNKDDQFDAYVLADTLRTDRARLRPLIPDSPATQTPRATVRARRDLVGHRVALCNQLRAHLQRVFPGAVGLFRDLDSSKWAIINLTVRARGTAELV